METTLQKDTIVQEAVETVCRLMAVSAITAPKTKGENFVQVKVLAGEDLPALAAAMAEYGREPGKGNFDRDGRNVAKSDAVVLIGLKAPSTAGLDCGACGYDLCDELQGAPTGSVEFNGPFCAYRLLDMGIALGSAVKTAGMLNVDSRIMYRVGAAVKRMGLVDWEFVIGVPLSVTGKSIYFDR